MTTDAVGLHHAGIAKIGQDLVTAGKLTKSFSTAPEKLDTAELPALYTLTGSAVDNEDYGEREENTVRTYRIQVPVIPTGQATPTIRETQCRTLLEVVRKELKKHPQLLNQLWNNNRLQLKNILSELS